MARHPGFDLAARARDAFSRRSRAARMARFVETMGVRDGMRIVDVGGVPAFWSGCPVRLELTLVNLPGRLPSSPAPSHHAMRLLEGDGRATGLADGAFDLAFSNSVIEHVGPRAEQARLAAEIRRLAPRYWVQTPSIWFPVEAHSMMPFWWFYPASLRAWFLARWRRRLPGWAKMVAETTVLRHADLRALFPEAEIWTERRLGWPKSYVAWHR